MPSYYNGYYYWYGTNSNDDIWGYWYANNKIIGYNGSDDLYGGYYTDYLWGYGDNDYLFGFSSRDHLYGGSGDDYLEGGYGSDILYGGSGSDRIFVGNNGYYNGSITYDVDYAFGGSGNDYIYGDSGNDIIYGEGDSDILRGYDGDDNIYGGSGNDYLIGGNGNDTMYGGEGNDNILDNNGEDTIIGGLGADKLWNSGGSDTFVYNHRSESTKTGADIIKYFSEEDQLDISGIDVSGGMLSDDYFNTFAVYDDNANGMQYMEDFLQTILSINPNFNEFNNVVYHDTVFIDYDSSRDTTDVFAFNESGHVDFKVEIEGQHNLEFEYNSHGDWLT